MEASVLLAICLKVGENKNFLKVGCQLKCKALYKKGDKGISGKHGFSESAFITLLLMRPSDAMATNFL
jgi:hypothetical protein